MGQYTHLCFYDCFPGKPGLASSPVVFFRPMFWKRMSGKKHHPTNTVKTLKETKCTDPSRWPSLILLSSTHSLAQLSDSS